MARPTDSELAKLSLWPGGINNVASEAMLRGGQLRSAVNVDIDDTGVPSRRVGYTQLAAESGAHSLWSNGVKMFYAAGSNLRMHDGVSSQLLYTNLQHDVPLCYATIEPNTYISDGTVALCVRNDGSLSTWGVTAPEGPTYATPLEDVGGMAAGDYLVAITYSNDLGEESGTGSSLRVTVPEGGGITVGFPPVAPPDAVRTRLYISKPNGSQPLFASSFAANAASVTVGHASLGRALDTQFCARLPAANFAAYYNGRLYIASGDMLQWSRPLAYGLLDEAYAFQKFMTNITGIAAMPEGGGGIYVGTGTRMYFLRGKDPSNFDMVEAYPSGVVPGSLVMVPATALNIETVSLRVPVWMSTSGVFCVGGPNGQVLATTEAYFSGDVAERAAALFRSVDGINQVLVSMQKPLRSSKLAVTDSASATVVRNGIEV